MVPPDELDAAVEDLARTIASKSSYAVALGKESFYRQRALSLGDALAYTGTLIPLNLSHPGRAGRQSPPSWKSARRSGAGR